MTSLETLPHRTDHHDEAEEESSPEALSGTMAGSESKEGANTHEIFTTGMLERHPDWPKLDVDFWFTPHENREDVEGIQAWLAETDVYFYENSTPEFTVLLQGISKNPEMPLEQIIEKGEVSGVPIKDSFWEPVIRGVYGSQVVVGNLDLRPDEQEIRRELHDVIATALPIEGSFHDSLETFIETSARMAIGQNQREQLMMRNFEEDIEAILQSNPELKEKENLKILISIGSYHTTLGHLFAKEGIESKRHFPGRTKSGYMYSSEVELWRTIAMQKEPSIELAKRAYIERLVRHTVDTLLEHASVPSIQDDLEDPIVRMLTSLLDENQMEEIYKIFQKDELTTAHISAAFAEKGVDNLMQMVVGLASVRKGEMEAKGVPSPESARQ